MNWCKIVVVVVVVMVSVELRHDEVWMRDWKRIVEDCGRISVGEKRKRIVSCLSERK